MRLPSYLLAAVLSAGAVAGQGLPSGDPAALARRDAAELGNRIRALLSSELAAGGFPGAVAACSRLAGKATREFAASTGRPIRRVSLRARNPRNAPDSWETRKLAELEALHREKRLPEELHETVGGQLRYLKPIVVEPMCLSCHGDPASIAPEVRRTLAATYPEDRATGYRAGDFRGAFSVTVPAKTRRVCAAQPRSRLIDWRLDAPGALAEVGRNLDILEGMVRRAGDAGCDVFALPEDTLGLLHWEAGNTEAAPGVLRQAVPRMLDRLGRAAAARRMYLILSSDTAEADGSIRNAAYFLGRDGKQIGRYDKVNLPLHEASRKRGAGFPVFETPDLGGVGMLICYDMVMPEATRALALAGADIVFLVTMGGSVFGDAELNRAGFRVRAVDNFVYLAVAKRGGGALVVSPQGKVLAEGKEPDDIAMADIDPFAGREAGDALNSQRDMRARLFRERNPAAYGLLTDPHPPVLDRIPETTTVEQAVSVGNKTLTAGNDRFSAAEALRREGKTAEAIRAFERLIEEFPATWIERQSRARLETLRGAK